MEYQCFMDNLKIKLKAEEAVVDEIEEEVRFTNKENIRDKLQNDTDIIHQLRDEKENLILQMADSKQDEIKLMQDIEILENKCTELMVQRDQLNYETDQVQDQINEDHQEVVLAQKEIEAIQNEMHQLNLDR